MMQREMFVSYRSNSLYRLHTDDEWNEYVHQYYSNYANIQDESEEQEQEQESEGHGQKCPLCRCLNITYEKISEKEESSEGFEELCVVCMDNHANIKYNQCGHQCVCDKCIEKF
jgi:hypothetical protein